MKKGFLLGGLGTIASVVVLAAPVLQAPTTRLLGNFQSEAATHAPVLAAALEGLGTHGPFVLAEHPLHPNEINGAMYEPITTLLMWPVYAVAGGGITGFTLAWNVWQVLAVFVTALGAWIWARAWLGDERDPDGWGAGAAMVLASASTFIHLGPEIGRTEAQNYPMYALHAGLVFRAARLGGRAWIWAALSVVPIIWSGGYGAVFAAIAEALLSAWALSFTPNRKGTIRGLMAVAATAALAAVPLVLALQEYPYVGISGRNEDHTIPSVALSVLVMGSENLLRELPGYEAAPFAGFVTLIAALLAPVRYRKAVWPLGAGALLYWIAAGPSPTIGETELWGPAAILSKLPGPSDVLRGWSRIFAFAIPFFAVAAAATTGGRAPIAIVLAVLGLLETGRLRVSQIHVEGEGLWFTTSSWWTLELAPEVVAMRAAGDNPILVPIDGIERTRRWLAPPHPPDVWRAMADHDLFKYLQDSLPNEPELFRNRFGSEAASYDPCTLMEDAVGLRNIGFTGIYLRKESLPRDGRGIATRAIKAVFGAPKEEGLWRIPEVVPTECGFDDTRPADIVLHGEEGAEGGRPRTPAERAAIREERKKERERVRQERARLKNERPAE